MPSLRPNHSSLAPQNLFYFRLNCMRFQVKQMSHTKMSGQAFPMGTFSDQILTVPVTSQFQANSDTIGGTNAFILSVKSFPDLH